MGILFKHHVDEESYTIVGWRLHNDARADLYVLPLVLVSNAASIFK
jgi:hypothetical protein